MFLRNFLYRKIFFFNFFLLLILLGCKKKEIKNNSNILETQKKEVAKELKLKQNIKGEQKMSNQEIATFAGGCFWCMEKPYDEIKGILKVEVGYSGKDDVEPTYENVAGKKTKYFEAVQITFDPNEISYGEVVAIFWRQIDPTDEGGQFADRGNHYKTAIFFHDEYQKEQAEKSKKELEESGKFDKPIATKILPFENFYLGEEYHQDFYKKNPQHYQQYRKGSGRDDFLKKNWKEGEKIFSAEKNKTSNNKLSNDKLSKEELKKKLTPMQYHVTQENGTEPAFKNEYFDHKGEGIYVDIVSGEVLFSSKDKYDSGCGWPSFDRSVASSNVVFKEDNSHGMKRIEVRSKNGDSHLGHIFDDGPTETTGKRFCINSAAIRFIPKEDLKKEGYENWENIFEK